MSSLRSALAVQFGGFPRPVWVLFTGTVVSRLGYLVGPFLVFFLATRGVSAEQTPYVLGALGAGNLVGPMLGGLLADRLGRRPTMLIGLTGNAAAAGALFAAPGLVTLALAAALLSAAGALVTPAVYAMMADTVMPERRRAAYSLFGWGINVGTAVAGVLGGFLAERGYWLLFGVDAATSLAVAFVIAVLLPADRSGRAPETEGAGYGVVLRDRLLLALLPLFGVQLLVYSLTEVALPLAIRDDGLSPAVYGFMAMVNAVVVVVLQPVATGLLTRLPQLPVLGAASVLIAVGVALTGVAERPVEYALTVLLWSVGEACVGGIAAAIVANLAPAHARGRYQGAFQWTWGLARFIALTVGAAVYTSFDPAVLWWSALVAGVSTGIAVVAMGPAVARRTAVPEPAGPAKPVGVAVTA
ncbi:MFS transporter [Streptosporangium sandarakinum]|uniref:MFS family permease n=1 Tax=Streptosporangium sandarakinum TaxID=1260955 RepID=A0A852V793_9ACTN|nr:MFS transporter [Streptosporangium sandarakinum]NYF42231.1 MFS family permease [Streptosporangium sandarakinum]